MDVGKDQEFTINTSGAGGQGKVDVKITSPSRRPIPCKVETGVTSEIHTVKYMPPEEGPYKVDISYDGHPVPGSPFTVEAVMPPDPSKVSKEQKFFNRKLCSFIIFHCFLFQCFLLKNDLDISEVVRIVKQL